jgi:prophage regulatory protein
MPTLLRQPIVLQKTGLSRSGLYLEIAKGNFPKPVKIGGGRVNAWPENEVDDYIAARIAEREAA